LTYSDHRSVGIKAAGGTLHGNWLLDSPLLTSDRRLKRSIEPLHRAIARASGASSDASDNAKDGSEKTHAGWVLRELRPVSFKFKSGPEAKHSRYGFVAQELKQVLPSLVRETDDKQHMAVAYQDLIALLTLTAQELQHKVAALQERSRTNGEKNARQESAISTVLKYAEELDMKLEKRAETRRVLQEKLATLKKRRKRHALLNQTTAENATDPSKFSLWKADYKESLEIARGTKTLLKSDAGNRTMLA